MDDLRHRDLSSKPESELTADERLELNRRFEEVVGLHRVIDASTRPGGREISGARVPPDGSSTRCCAPIKSRDGLRAQSTARYGVQGTRS